jgi:formylglycine-generating enzyme required for sulfatase activity
VLLKPYPYQADDGREQADPTENRALHGGSWFNVPVHARAAYRALPSPTYQTPLGSNGFRVAVGAVSGA